MTSTDRQFWMQIRQALLMLVDAVERQHKISPRTSDLRRERKQQLREYESKSAESPPEARRA